MKKVLAVWALAAALAACHQDPIEPVTTAPPQEEMPMTGVEVPSMKSYDKVIGDMMRKYNLPGGAVAVVHDGRLIYARGFGYADVEHKTLAQPDALFRIASVSKSLTAVAIMKLVEDGKLTFDDRVAPIIADLVPASGATVDSRWEQITIRNLLNHTGGWDRNNPNGGFDPIDRPITAANAVGAPVPASPETLVRYMKGMPLDFNPGEKFAYSNFGYIVLGRVIERLSGMKYADFVRTRVLDPVGASRTQQGKSRLSGALPEEVKYYWPGSTVSEPLVPSVFPGEGLVPLNYGGFHLEGGDASGAWVSSTIDLLRFMNGVDGRATPPDILGEQAESAMTGSGAAFCSQGVSACYYAAGWFVTPVAGGLTWWHTGTLPGTTSILMRAYNGFSWVALFNSRSLTANLEVEANTALWKAFAGVTAFPSTDLFPTFR